MKKNLSRKEFLAVSVLGVAGAMASASFPQVALADSMPDSEVRRYMPDIPSSNNDEINRMNDEALELWGKAVRESLANGSEIVVVNNPPEVVEDIAPNPLTRGAMPTYYSPSCTKTVGWWPNSCTLGFTAYYYAIPGWVSRFSGATSYAASWGASVTHLSYSYATVNGGRSYAVNYTTQVTWQPGIPLQSTEIITSYAQFDSNGSCWVR